MKFLGEFSYLSNSFNCKVEFDGLVFNNSEAAYQSCKFKDIEDKKKFTNLDATQARVLGRTAHIDINSWNDIRCDIMYKVNKAKFDQHPELIDKLLSMEIELIEYESHDDKYWGIDGSDGRKKLGHNKLGKILTQLRNEYKKARKS